MLATNSPMPSSNKNLVILSPIAEKALNNEIAACEKHWGHRAASQQAPHSVRIARFRRRIQKVRSMPMEREIQEMIARIVGILVFYSNSEKSTRAKDLMTSEVQAVAASVAEKGWDQGSILRGVEDELVARYGPQVGARVQAEFVRAFAVTCLQSCHGMRVTGTYCVGTDRREGRNLRFAL